MSDTYFGEILAKKYPWACSEDKNCVYLECDSGWDNLIDSCLGEIEEYYKTSANSEQLPYVQQIKEKFAGLRIYLSWENDAISDIIAKYEQQSLRTCEICGVPGILHHKSGWIKTLCPDCAAQNEFVEGGR